MPCWVPDAVVYIRVQLGQPPQQRKRHRDGMIGYHFGRVTGHIAYRHAKFACCCKIDRIVANARSRNHLKLRQRRKHLARKLAISRDDPFSISAILDDARSALVLEACKFNARILDHLLLDIRYHEITVRDHDLCHDALLAPNITACFQFDCFMLLS